MFQGELMRCLMCNKTKLSNPRKQSQWTFIQYGDKSCYVCPKCLQDSPEGKQGDFTTPYERVLRKLMETE